MTQTRRQFLQTVAATTALPLVTGALPAAAATSGSGAFLSLLRAPDSLTAFTESGETTLQAATEGHWQGNDITVMTLPQADGLGVTLAAPLSAVKRLRLRWRGDLSALRLVLGDAWERAYGDLQWDTLVPGRAMPWYFAAWDGTRTHGYGVLTRPAAFCAWQVDSEGVTLWLDVRSGGKGLRLGARRLDVCTVVCRPGQSGETPFAALRAFCRQMCPLSRLPAQPVYGHNDWYADYGNNSDAKTRALCPRIVALSPGGTNKPFMVIDDGWQPNSDVKGPWNRGNARFPDMPGLADFITQAGARPGIWIRPLSASDDAPASWRMPRDPSRLDPTVPEARQQIAADVARLRQWGYQLIKHDYSSYDILGKWGFAMGWGLTDDGWGFAGGQGQTTAEVFNLLYRTIREAAGDSLVIGCNTISHLSAGIFEMNRVGDDTSGQEWDRTRRMGVNALAFRGAQSGAFYVADADCVGLTQAVPWELNRQWLDVLAHSGTMTFVSVQTAAFGPEQERALRAAFAAAAQPRPVAEPLDWMRTTCPAQWRQGDHDTHYRWIEATGVPPLVPNA